MMDLSSKAKLMDHIEKEYAEWGEDYDALQILGDIEDFPSAETERKKGRWIRKDDGHFLQCEFCNRVIREPFGYRFKFCPNCGARMDGK